MIEIEQPPGSIAIADAMFDINIDDAAIIITSSFFFIYQSFQVSRYIYQPPIRGQLTPGIEFLAQFVTHPHQLEGGGGGERLQPGSSVSIAIADAKFGINVGIAAISSTSSFFFISQSFQVSRQIYQPPIRSQSPVNIS
jgi:hypothetical protein